MPKFVTIGYGDQTGYERTPASIRDEAHEQDAKLLAEGLWLVSRANRCKCAIPRLPTWKRRMGLSCHRRVRRD
jgi:hypothetical protein